MAIRRAGQTVTVAGPHAKSIDVKFFNDGSVRFRLNDAGPMVVKYAFLPGSGQNVIVELMPMRPSPWLNE